MEISYRKKTIFYSDFEEPATDPKSDLLALIEQKESAFVAYSRRYDAKDAIKDRLVQDIIDLRAIFDKMINLKLYTTWCGIENRLKYYKDKDGDGLWLIVPFVENAKPDRMFYFDLRKHVK